MADKPCDTCRNFDPIVKGDGKVTTRHGWCAAKSEYPAVEMPGQVFPPGVKRVQPGELAKPCIVGTKEIVPACALRRDK